MLPVRLSSGSSLDETRGAAGEHAPRQNPALLRRAFASSGAELGAPAAQGALAALADPEDAGPGRRGPCREGRRGCSRTWAAAVRRAQEGPRARLPGRPPGDAAGRAGVRLAESPRGSRIRHRLHIPRSSVELYKLCSTEPPQRSDEEAALDLVRKVFITPFQRCPAHAQVCIVQSAMASAGLGDAAPARAPPGGGGSSSSTGGAPRAAQRPAALGAPPEHRQRAPGAPQARHSGSSAGGAPQAASDSPRQSSAVGRPQAGSLEQARKVGTKMALRFADSCRRTVAKSRSMAVAFVRDPRIVAVWYKDIRDTVAHFCTWVATGFRLFWADLRTSFVLAKRVLQGFPLTVRQRKLLVRTTSDCLKLIPFSFFIIVPFAEVLLPFALRLFPNMLPSTFFDKKVDDASLARKFKAKQELAEFWQQVVVQRTQAPALGARGARRARAEARRVPA
ncbi:unnamed protein product [Prorocentrum cordatum]|uniref:Letm1 RBD domain-containing protein n=1 Tax=Prorocentrum cordatum TaxID=2364126 RepID=A0ABN9W352_9DINO|nr:unnamed protein product [Polarella glacialis]